MLKKLNGIFKTQVFMQIPINVQITVICKIRCVTLTPYLKLLSFKQIHH